MARRPYRALGVITTPVGDVIVRKTKAPKQRTFVLVLDGPNDALRLVLPAWRPRSPTARRTQVTPPTPITRAAGIMAFYNRTLPSWLEAVKRGVEAATPARPAYTTLAELVAVVDAESTALRAVTVGTYRRHWRYLESYLPGSTPLAAITRERLQAVVSRLMADQYAATTIRNLIATLHRTLARAVQDEVLTRNPLDQVKRPRVVVTGRAFVEQERWDALLTVAEQHSRDAHLLVALGLFAGLRKAELLALRWSDLDLDRRVLAVRNGADFTTKSGRDRSVPIAERLHGILQRYRPDRPGEAFVLRPDHAPKPNAYRWDFRSTFATVMATAAVAISPHGMRHSFATAGAHRGLDIHRLRRWLGHASIRVTEGYIHGAGDALDHDIDRLGEPIKRTA